MDFLIPYTKEITFDSKIAEIVSISLEHEMDINEGEILGNFIVSGEYKAHELSANKEDFKHTIPFNIDLPNNIDKDSISLDITDFTYEILKDNILKVIIEVNLKGKEKEEIFETPKEEIDVRVVEELPDKEEKDDEYITYHIHIYHEGEDLDNICKLYNSNMDLLKEYNNLDKISNNDKLLIVEEDE